MTRQTSFNDNNSLFKQERMVLRYLMRPENWPKTRTSSQCHLLHFTLQSHICEICIMEISSST